MHSLKTRFEVSLKMCSSRFYMQFEKTSRMSRETEDRLKAIPNFCFPDAQDWRPSADINRSDDKTAFLTRVFVFR